VSALLLAVLLPQDHLHLSAVIPAVHRFQKIVPPPARLAREVMLPHHVHLHPAALRLKAIPHVNLPAAAPPLAAMLLRLVQLLPVEFHQKAILPGQVLRPAAAPPLAVILPPPGAKAHPVPVPADLHPDVQALHPVPVPK